MLHYIKVSLVGFQFFREPVRLFVRSVCLSGPFDVRSFWYRLFSGPAILEKTVPVKTNGLDGHPPVSHETNGHQTLFHKTNGHWPVFLEMTGHRAVSYRSMSVCLLLFDHFFREQTVNDNQTNGQRLVKDR